MVITSRLAPPRPCTVGTTPGGGRTRGDLVRCTGEMECRSRVTPLSFRCCRSVHAASPKPVTTLRTNYMLTRRDRKKSRICSSFPPLCLFLYVSVLCVCVSLTLSDAGCAARRFRRASFVGRGNAASAKTRPVAAGITGCAGTVNGHWTRFSEQKGRHSSSARWFQQSQSSLCLRVPASS